MKIEDYTVEVFEGDYPNACSGEVVISNFDYHLKIKISYGHGGVYYPEWFPQELQNIIDEHVPTGCVDCHGCD